MGTYQLFMMRIPQHAAVNETVDAAKRLLGRGAASFVNAVLRRTAEGLGELTWPSREDFVDYLEIVHSHPRWLVEYLVENLGKEEAEALCIADNAVPELTLRVNTSIMSSDDLIAEIRNLGGDARPSPYLQESLIGVSLPHKKLMDLLEKGCCMVQDESSMLVSRAVDPPPGSTIVDACAAPGGKSTHLALLGGENCKVIAIDKNLKRLKALANLVSRQRLRNIEVKEGDAACLSEFLDEKIDAVLVDAPCSGLGTLQRNPELKWRRREEELSVMANNQLKLLDGCAESLSPGGILVYSVCTFTQEETTSVLDRFISEHDDFRPTGLAPHLPEPFSIEAGSSGHIQLMLHIHSMEGMFITRLEKHG
jgi:16S rRNA (cytosine967-C5)-methyltransferase